MQENLVKELKKLNLTEKEARVYLALLELGPATPYKMAKHARLKRPTAYVIAEELVEKGLIVQMTGEKKRMYIARSPETYVEEVERRVREAKRAVPELLALQRQTGEKPNVLYFEGTEGIKRAYQYRAKESHNKEITGFFAKSIPDPELHNEVFIPWQEYRKEHNIRYTGFTVDDPGNAQYTPFYKDTINPFLMKFLPPALYDAESSCEALDWGVRIVIMKTKQAIIIESGSFALLITQVFKLLWQKTEGEYDTPKNIGV